MSRGDLDLHGLAARKLEALPKGSGTRGPLEHLFDEERDSLIEPRVAEVTVTVSRRPDQQLLTGPGTGDDRHEGGTVPPEDRLLKACAHRVGHGDATYDDEEAPRNCASSARRSSGRAASNRNGSPVRGCFPTSLPACRASLGSSIGKGLWRKLP